MEDIHTFISVLGDDKKTEISRFVKYFENLSVKKQESIWKSLQERIKKLLDVTTIFELLDGPGDYDPAVLVWKKSTKDQAVAALIAVKSQFESIADEDFIVDVMQSQIIEWIKTTEWGNGDVLWPTRYALTGLQQSPSPFEVAEVIGKDETIRRIDSGITALSKIA